MLAVLTKKERDWVQSVVKEEEIERYMRNGRDFIDDDEIWEKLRNNKKPDKKKIEDIIQKSMEIQTLEPDETACLLNIEDPEIWHQLFDVAKNIKKKVYDNRIVTFAPLYCGDLCVNNCLYCGFRRENIVIKRKRLTLEEIRRETEVLAGEIGHKRLIVVYGEHPSTDAAYIADTIRTIYDVKVKTKNGYGQIRRVNVNIAPMSIDDLSLLRDVGIGTY